MSYKPDEKDWMAYLYGELEGKDKEKFETYLLENADARAELEKYQGMRGLLGTLEDKEVIAPPIVLGDSKSNFTWNAPYFKTILSVAASLMLLMLCAKLLDIRFSSTQHEFKISFGEPVVENVQPSAMKPAVTPQEVQQMIDNALQTNNSLLAENWKENEQKLTASIRKNLVNNNGNIDQLVREASLASQEQIRDYVAGIQQENMQMVKDYFQLTSTEQKKYVENLLVDFAAYLQQQRSNDLQLVETRLNSLQQNTNVLKQETEQILSSIISSVGSPSTSKGVKN